MTFSVPRLHPRLLDSGPVPGLLPQQRVKLGLHLAQDLLLHRELAALVTVQGSGVVKQFPPVLVLQYKWL